MKVLNARLLVGIDFSRNRTDLHAWRAFLALVAGRTVRARRKGSRFGVVYGVAVPFTIGPA